MKRVQKYCFLCLITVFALSLVNAQTTISGIIKFKGAHVYNNMIVNEVQGNKILPIDTIKIDAKGRYEIKLEMEQPMLYVVKFMPSQNETTYWFVEPKKNVKLDYEIDEYPVLSGVKGSKNMEVYKTFVEINRPIELLNRKYYSASGEDKKKIEEEFRNIYPQIQTSIKNHILENKNVLISAFLVTCFDQEFADYFLVYEAVRDNLIAKYPNNLFVKNLDERVKKAVLVGSMAPEIIMNSPNGEELKLSDLRGKVVLVDFWASWCGPCRRENPNVVRLYEKYKDKGFEIFSVSLDKDKNAWVKAIDDDNLKWKWHVSDLKYWSSAAAKLYGISSIPSTVLVGKDGKIIAKNLRGYELEKKLQEIFND